MSDDGGGGDGVVECLGDVMAETEGWKCSICFVFSLSSVSFTTQTLICFTNNDSRKEAKLLVLVCASDNREGDDATH